MEMSVREARAQFAAALSAAERGERVTITKNGKPVAEIGPPTVVEKRRPKVADYARIQAELGIPTPVPPLDDEWLRDFNDPAWTEELFGPFESPPRHARLYLDGDQSGEIGSSRNSGARTARYGAVSLDGVAVGDSREKSS